MAKPGKPQFNRNTDYAASPLAADGRVYLPSHSGTVVVVNGRAKEPAAISSLSGVSRARYPDHRLSADPNGLLDRLSKRVLAPKDDLESAVTNTRNCHCYEKCRRASVRD